MIVKISEDDEELINAFNKEIPSWITFDDDTVLSYGMEENGKLLGIIQIEEWSNGLMGISIATLPKYRRLKIASKLIEYVIEVLTEVNYSGPILMAINKSNKASIGLAKSLGFENLKNFNELEVETYVRYINCCELAHNQCNPFQ